MTNGGPLGFGILPSTGPIRRALSPPSHPSLKEVRRLKVGDTIIATQSMPFQWNVGDSFKIRSVDKNVGGIKIARWYTFTNPKEHAIYGLSDYGLREFFSIPSMMETR